MFPLMIPILAGAALGGLKNKKNPLEGALLGGALGAGGGALMGLGAAGATGAEATAGLLGNGAASGAGSQAAMLAEQNAGFGAIGDKMLGEAAGTQVPMQTKFMAGLQSIGDGAKTFSKEAAPFMNAMGTAQQVGGLLQDTPVQGHAPQGINPQGAQTLAQLAQQGQVNPEELMKRRYQTNWG